MRTLTSWNILIPWIEFSWSINLFTFFSLSLVYIYIFIKFSPLNKIGIISTVAKRIINQSLEGDTHFDLI